ncbi:MAG TPA: hypothetical protein VFV52_12095 [Bacilli bacterium]|nr:hypothetical protein [Bacilli bacterium]
MERKKQKQAPTFEKQYQEELYYAGKQFYKTLFIIVVLAIILYLTHFLSKGFTVLFAFIGIIMLMATLTYSIGHFVRYLIFKAKGK